MDLSGVRSTESVVVPPVAGGDDALAPRTLRKAAWRLLPLLCVCYIIASIDRANVSYAALQMNRDLGFDAEVYGFGAGVFFLGYALCEVPSNYLLLRFGARRWISRIMVTWGLLAAGMAFVHSPMSFYTMRILLGIAEAGFAPAVLYYLSQWFPQEVRARAISRYYVGISISYVLSGLVAGPLLHLNGRMGLRGWQWLFLVEGVPAIALGVLVFFVLPDGPESAAWIQPEELAWLQRRLGNAPEGRGHGNPFRALKDRRVLLFGAHHFCMVLTSTSFIFSAPMALVALTGWSAGRVGVLLAAIALLGSVSMLVFAKLSDLKRTRVGFMVPLIIVMTVAYTVTGLARGPHAMWIVIAALTVAMTSYYGTSSLALTLSVSLLQGPQAAIGIAAVNMMGIMGSFVGPYWMGWSKVRTGSYRLGWGMMVVPCVLAIALLLAAVGRGIPVKKSTGLQPV
jgi:MFS transporter, ACS family, tartrate transporter